MSAVVRNHVSSWSLERETAFTYLWYLGIHDVGTLSKYTGEEAKRCTNKKAQYPHLSKYNDMELLHRITRRSSVFESLEKLQDFAIEEFHRKPQRDFDEIAKILTQRGVKPPDIVYRLWLGKYKVNQDELPDQAVSTFLSKAHFSKKAKYNSWISVEQKLYSEYRFDAAPYRLAAIYKNMKGDEMIQVAEELLQLKEWSSRETFKIQDKQKSD